MAQDHGSGPPAPGAGMRNKRTLSPPRTASGHPAQSSLRCSAHAHSPPPGPGHAACPKRLTEMARICCCAWAWLWLACASALAQAQTVKIHAAQAVESDSPGFPADRSAPRVDLPDDWSGQPPRQQRPGVVPGGLHRARSRARGAHCWGCIIEHACTNLRSTSTASSSTAAVRRASHHEELQPPAVGEPAGRRRSARVNTLDIKLVGQAPTRVASAHAPEDCRRWRRPVVSAPTRHTRQVAQIETVAQASDATPSNGRLHVRDGLDEPARGPPGLLWRAVGGVGDGRVAPWLRDLPVDGEAVEFLLAP